MFFPLLLAWVIVRRRTAWCKETWLVLREDAIHTPGLSLAATFMIAAICHSLFQPITTGIDTANGHPSNADAILWAAARFRRERSFAQWQRLSHGGLVGTCEKYSDAW